MATTNLNVRVDEDVKRDVEEILDEIGLNMSTAINIFLKKVARDRGIPFPLKAEQPNKETLEAFAEVEEMKKNPDKYKGYTDVDDMMRDLLA